MRPCDHRLHELLPRQLRRRRPVGLVARSGTVHHCPRVLVCELPGHGHRRRGGHTARLSRGLRPGAGPAGDHHPAQHLARPAHGGHRPVRLHVHQPARHPRAAGPALHPAGHGHRPGDPDRAAHRRPDRRRGQPGGRALPPHRADTGRGSLADRAGGAARGPFRYRRSGDLRLWPRHFRDRHFHDARRQHQGLHPDHDHGHGPGIRQGRLHPGRGPGARAHGHQPGHERGLQPGPGAAGR